MTICPPQRLDLFGIHFAGFTKFSLDPFRGSVENLEERKIQDRRVRPTPAFSRYTFWGQRKALRRKADQERGGYVDRYHPRLLILIVLIVG